MAKAQGELKPGTDCLQLSQLIAASQWGVTLLWQKQLISLEALEQQAIMKHCLDLMPFAQPETGVWLQKLLCETGGLHLYTEGSSPIEEQRMAS